MSAYACSLMVSSGYFLLWFGSIKPPATCQFYSFTLLSRLELRHHGVATTGVPVGWHTALSHTLSFRSLETLLLTVDAN
uniref:Putative secreted protein n=1 Tax=Anopheles darlingi TaxID=43151 RepID=A0A2M4DGL3_ANODA